MSDATQMPATSTPPVERMLQFFVFKHLPEHLQEASRPFCLLAMDLCDRYPPDPERTVALRKLLEAKDCAVRLALTEKQ